MPSPLPNDSLGTTWRSIVRHVHDPAVSCAPMHHGSTRRDDACMAAHADIRWAQIPVPPAGHVLARPVHPLHGCLHLRCPRQRNTDTGRQIHARQHVLDGAFASQQRHAKFCICIAPAEFTCIPATSTHQKSSMSTKVCQCLPAILDSCCMLLWPCCIVNMPSGMTVVLLCSTGQCFLAAEC